MQDQITQQQKQSKSKWSTQIRGNKLLIQYQGNISYQGYLDESPFFSLKVIKEIIDREEVQILMTTSNKMKIRIMTIINVELNNQNYVEIQKLKKRVDQLEEQLKKTLWQEDDLASTQPFDINYLYRVKLNNTISVICTYIDANTLYHFSSGNAIYSIQKANRKASSIGYPVSKIWKKKIE